MCIRDRLYRGVVIKIAGHGDKKRFTVRKMSGTVGVERIFPLESPAIDSIEVNKVGKVCLLYTSLHWHSRKLFNKHYQKDKSNINIYITFLPQRRFHNFLFYHLAERSVQPQIITCLLYTSYISLVGTIAVI